MALNISLVEFELLFVVLGMKVFVHGGAATPSPLLDALAERGKEAGLKDIELIHIHTEGSWVVVEPEYDGKQYFFSLLFARCSKETTNRRLASLQSVLNPVSCIFTVMFSRGC